MSIAILTSDRRKPFAGNHQNFADLIEMGKKLGIQVFVLTPSGLSADQSTVQGYLLQRAKPIPTFRAARLPWPKVVYNRVPYRSDEQSAPVIRAIKLCQQRNIPIFNPHFFDKWSLFRRLTNSNCRSYLPATTKWGDFETFHRSHFKTYQRKSWYWYDESYRKWTICPSLSNQTTKTMPYFSHLKRDIPTD
jgi:hypothetical protein